MNKHIFREYDIRGVVKDDLTRDVVEKLGMAMGTRIPWNGHGYANPESGR